MIRSAVCALLIAAVALVPVRSAAGDPLTVVELFTSQGCSSCPPADALVGVLVEREGVLVLSEHVDYWDYLGWRDPFAIPATTQRQRDYARRLGVGYVYTPQMVIQGASQVTGSNREAVFNRLEEPEPWSPLAVDIDRTGDGRIVITVGGAPAGEDAADGHERGRREAEQPGARPHVSADQRERGEQAREEGGEPLPGGIGGEPRDRTSERPHLQEWVDRGW